MKSGQRYRVWNQGREREERHGLRSKRVREIDRRKDRRDE